MSNPAISRPVSFWLVKDSKPPKGRFKLAKFFQKKSKVPNTWNLYAGIPPNVFRTIGTKLGPKNFDWSLPNFGAYFDLSKVPM